MSGAQYKVMKVGLQLSYCLMMHDESDLGFYGGGLKVFGKNKLGFDNNNKMILFKPYTQANHPF